jgi:hypothetical protein
MPEINVRKKLPGIELTRAHSGGRDEEGAPRQA